MHFAYPPRKSSNPPPFRLRPSNLPLRRRPRPRTVIIVLLTFLLGIFLLSRRGSGPDPYHEHTPTGNPPVVIVTVVDPSKFSGSYIKSIKENREQYARKHGYETHIPNVDDYDLVSHHKSWSKIMAMRHALTKYPDCKFIWYLDQDAYIMDPTKSLTSDLLDSKTLGGLMIKDYPIVPPDSIIKSFAHLKSDDARLVVSQDRDGLVSNSIFLRNGDWAKFLTETWLDPLYRSYNFQKAERHALEHMVQWHPTILSKIALIPQRLIASYTRANLGAEYREGDFVVMFYGCTVDGERSCDSESQLYRQKWQTAFQAS